MIKLYFYGSTATSRKARNWLIDHKITFKEKNITASQLSREDFNHILSLTESGIDDIVSKRTLIYKELSPIWDELTLNEIFEYIIENPVLLKKPLIFDENKLQIGFNSDDIRMFLPKEFRVAEKNLFSNN
ncbi:Spx/MgsR family RNA polymerase-binding regulatory protein [Lactococcus lactis]|uniref:Spx/MgsR family RNA polymerase-binding regulatory protein n=1 Tax=Lactococcus lactis TaxID=1358 RepID=UPI0019123EAA|nr:Spx/MgsR family RNA polymerase-binding regulatory protein [Lactococcus lactis]WDA68471.1 Spx/MgsR family RNA polymerase-binding regulatory protein [Lactococcus lactis]